MTKRTFLQLVLELRQYGAVRDTKYMTGLEKTAIFVHIAVTGMSFRHACQRFQHSLSTISKLVHFCHFGGNSSLMAVYRTFHSVLNSIVSKTFYRRYVFLPPDETPSCLLHDPKFYPFFKDVRAAIDGSQYKAYMPSAVDALRHRNRHGDLTQNVLSACTFDLRFCYCLSGWEGSAADGRIWEDARRKDLYIPHGRMYLADAGFPSCDALLVPYRATRYHLAEFERSDLRYNHTAQIGHIHLQTTNCYISCRPQNSKELFNLRHAEARNVVERIFGVSKRKFRLSTSTPEFELGVQAKIPSALAALFNFVRVHDPAPADEDSRSALYASATNPEQTTPRNPAYLGGFISADESRRADARRDAIAEAMWDQYQDELRRRNLA